MQEAELFSGSFYTAEKILHDHWSQRLRQIPSLEPCVHFKIKLGTIFQETVSISVRLAPIFLTLSDL